MGSCTDLDVQPTDGATDVQIFTTVDAFRSYLAKAYASFSHTGQDGPAGDADISIVNDEGFTSYIRAYWKAQELTTDEAVIAWTDAGVRDLHEHSWTSENQFVRVLYYRIALIISICNDFVRQASDENLASSSFSQDELAEIQTYVAEARFLRAMAYWHALDLFRNIPLVTEITTEAPFQVEPEEVYDFIETELKEIEELMVAPKANDYGRADRAANWMLQAKLYLNAPIYIGEDKNTECIDVCKKVINAGYELNPEYQHNFLADNHLSPELIFTLPSDGVFAQNWGNTTFLVQGAIGGDMEDSDYGVSGGWAGLRTTSAFVSKFPDVTGDIDSRAIFYTEGQSLEIEDIGEFTDGYAVPKYQNVTSGGAPGSDITHVDVDYPMFRLADAYLMYAEAVKRGGEGGSEAEAVQYINEIRERAYGNTDGNITEANLTLEFLLDERSRELYWEGGRRVDLLRYGMYTTEGIWPWKGNVMEGATTEAFRDIFPIPSSDLIANPNLEQNDGY